MIYWIWFMKQRKVLRINFMFMSCTARWMVVSFTRSVPDLGEQ